MSRRCPTCGQKIPDAQHDLFEALKWTARAQLTKDQAMELLGEFRISPTRRNDPPASKLAAVWWAETAGQRRQCAYAFLLSRGEHGAILEEVAAALNCAENSISTQLTTMREKMRLLTHGPEMRLSSRQTPQGVWRVAPDALIAEDPIYERELELQDKWNDPPGGDDE